MSPEALLGTMVIDFRPILESFPWILDHVGIKIHGFGMQIRRSSKLQVTKCLAKNQQRTCQELAKNSQRTRHRNTPTSKLQFAECRQPPTNGLHETAQPQKGGAAVSRRMASSIIRSGNHKSYCKSSRMQAGARVPRRKQRVVLILRALLRQFVVVIKSRPCKNYHGNNQKRQP